MKSSFILSALVLCIGLGACIEQNPTVGNQDDPAPIYFFLKFRNLDTEQDLFMSKDYKTDSLHLWYFGSDGTKSGPFFIQNSYKNNFTILGPILLAGLTGGLAERGIVSEGEEFESFSRLYFNNGDVDTIYSVVNCNNSCKFKDKTMQLYYNNKLVLDFDFRDKDSELLQNLLLNNRYPFKDTVIFTIEKRPEF